jgi:hypothetical protein
MIAIDLEPLGEEPPVLPSLRTIAGRDLPF